MSSPLHKKGKSEEDTTLTKSEVPESAEEKPHYLANRCKECDAEIKEYDTDTLSLCVANMCQFVKFNQTRAVPLLPRILSLLALIAEPLCYEEGNEHIVSTSAEMVFVAKQSMRCILHQLADHRIFSSLFLIQFPKGSCVLRVVIACLRDYHLFHCTKVLQHLLEDLPDDLKQPYLNLHCLLSNMANYLDHLHNEASIKTNWQPLANLFSSFFNKLHNYILGGDVIQLDDVVQVMLHLLKAPILIHTKSILLEPFSKVLAMLISKHSFSFKLLYELCAAGHDYISKDKDKLYLVRYVISRLVAALKLSSPMSTQNILYLLNITLLDKLSAAESFSYLLHPENAINRKPCYAMECMKHHVSECLDALDDCDFLDKVKMLNGEKQVQIIQALNLFSHTNDTGVKLAIGQVVAGVLHHYYNQSSQYNWLFQHSSSAQHGQKVFSECVSQLRKLSWILLGALSHLALQQGAWENLWCPIPLDKARGLASVVQDILTGYWKQDKQDMAWESKTSMTHLFYAFIFCQLWTVYCEQLSFFASYVPQCESEPASISFNSYKPAGDQNVSSLLLSFWGYLTPRILMLLKQNGTVSENIHRHIESLMTCLQQYDSAILYKLYPMWSPLLNTADNHPSYKSNHPSVRDLPSPVESTARYECTGHCNAFGYGASGFLENAARRNAQNVLNIVNSLNDKLSKLEYSEVAIF